MLTSLYIHIPFCSHICTYCDFHKEMAKDSKKEKYIKALLKEIEYYKEKIENVTTIYIGGGTPSSLQLSLLEELLVKINNTVNMNKVIEFSIETNPNDITEDFVSLIRKYNINRVSIGVQTFNEKHLTFLGRTHNKDDVINSIKLLRAQNFNNISVDMIFSLINQSKEELEVDLEELLKLDIDHISYYSLILEEKSKLFFLLNKEQISINSEELEGFMYNKVINTLTENGYDQYEISNFSKDKKESEHNKTYWLNKTYLGLGSGSHSMYDGFRYYNPTNITKYIEMITQNDFSYPSSYEYHALNEELMLGLRLTKGINIQEVNNKYNVDILQKYPELQTYLDRNIIEISDGYLRFTKEGILLGNLVFQIFVEVL